jgi:hypothetical protein
MKHEKLPEVKENICTDGDTSDLFICYHVPQVRIEAS